MTQNCLFTSQWKILFAFASVISIAFGRLKVMSPPELSKIFADKYDDGAIPASYANFGFMPYGQTIMGKLHYASDN